MDGNSERKVKEWYAFLNDGASLLGFSMFITAITSSAPEAVASAAFAFMNLWLFAKGRGVVKHLRREERVKGFFASNLGAVSGTLMFLISLVLLFTTSFGILTINEFKEFSFGSLWLYLMMLIK